MSEWNHFQNKLLENLDYQYFDARIIINFSSIGSSFGGLGLPSEFLPEQFRPEAIEKSLIEYRQTSEKIDSWDCSGFDSKNRLTET